MPDYKSMYLKMFNAATDAERLVKRAEQLTDEAYAIIRTAQRECEEMFMAETREPPADVYLL